MKHKLLKLNVVLMLGLGLAPLQGQTTMNVKATSGTKTTYVLSTIRKLTFPSTGNMTVTKTSFATDNYTLSNVRNVNFGVVNTGIEPTADAAKAILYVYPNPVMDVLNIEIANESLQITQIEIVGIDGKVALRSVLHETKSSISVSSLTKGLYLLRSNNGTSTANIKFIKQ